MKIVHTADWHLGQLFYQMDRTWEHGQFLEYLIQLLEQEQVDVLLISGDVFDNPNPSAQTITQFYQFLNKATSTLPNLQIVITAGNHDSAQRLEMPKPLLSSTNIHIIGVVPKTEDGSVDHEKLLVPLKGPDGSILAWCMAIPYLRMGDYPQVPNATDPYKEGITTFYKDSITAAEKIRKEGQALLCMGHLYMTHAEVSGSDDTERSIMGGIEAIDSTAFDERIDYVALGHIHKAQSIGGKDHIRYSGSPIPMSFTEIDYQHQVVLIEFEKGKRKNIQVMPIPVAIPLIRIPEKHGILEDVIKEIEQLPELLVDEPIPKPYLEVRILLKEPEPGLRFKIEEALKEKHVSLTRIDIKYAGQDKKTGLATDTTDDLLEELEPIDILSKAYEKKFGGQLPDDLRSIFHEIENNISSEE